MIVDRLRRVASAFDGFFASSGMTRWLLRAVSIVFAVTIWFLVSYDGSNGGDADTRQAVRTVALRFLDVPEGHALSSANSDVEVHMEGALDVLARLDSSEVTATISLKDMRPGKYRLPIHVDSPDGVRVVSCVPQQAEFELLRVIERTMQPLIDVPDDETAQGYDIQDVALTPPEIVVKGPEGDVMSVRRALVKLSMLDFKDSNGEMKLPVSLMRVDGTEAEGLEVLPPEVVVHARVVEPMEEVVVPITVPLRGTPADGFDVGSIVISPDKVVLRGTKEALANITELSIDPIDISGHSETMVMDIPLDAIGDRFSIVSAESVHVRVELHSTVDMMTFTGVPIRFSGQGAYDRWEASPQMANVTVERSVTSTEPFDPTKPPLELYVDVTNVVSGRLVLPVLARSLKDGMRVIRIDPQQVMVNAAGEGQGK